MICMKLQTCRSYGSSDPSAMAPQCAMHSAPPPGPPAKSPSKRPAAAARAGSSATVSTVTARAAAPPAPGTILTSDPPNPVDAPVPGLVHLGGRPDPVASPATECAWTRRSNEHVASTPRRMGDHRTPYRLCCDVPSPPP